MSKVSLPLSELDQYPWGGPIAVMVDPTAQLLGVLFALGYAKATETDLAGAWDVTSAEASSWAEDHAGELVKGIDEVSRERLRTLIAASAANPEATKQELADQIVGLFDDMAPERADLIAVTESATAANIGNLTGYGSFGGRYVEVSDGTSSDSECALANGQIWTIDDAMANPLQHPRCSRSFSYIPDSEVDPSMVASPGF